MIMKKLIIALSTLVVIVLGHADPALAQTEQGNFLVGGSVGNLNFRKGITSFSISPQGGYFVAENLALGLSADFAYTRFTSEFSPTFEGNSIGYGVGPFARYYIGDSRLRPLIQLLYSYNYSRLDVTSQVNETTTQLFAAGGGVAYFLTDNVAFESLISYNRDLNRNAAAPNSIDISFGFQIYLGK